MNVMRKAIKSCLRVLVWKIRYGNKVRISLPVAFDQVFLEKDREATVSVGERTQNRGKIYLICKEQGQLQIGEHCFFNTNVSITCMQKVTIGNYCKFGNNLVIVDNDHNYTEKNTDGRNKEISEYIKGDIVIGDRVWVGANSVILKGVTIGDDAVIGAGSVVRRDVLPGSVYYEKRTSQI